MNMEKFSIDGEQGKEGVQEGDLDAELDALARAVVEKAGGDLEGAVELYESANEIKEQEKVSGIEALEHEYYRKSMNVDFSATGIGAMANLFSLPLTGAFVEDMTNRGVTVENIVGAIVGAIGPTVIGFGVDYVRDLFRQDRLRREYATKRLALSEAA